MYAVQNTYFKEKVLCSYIHTLSWGIIMEEYERLWGRVTPDPRYMVYKPEKAPHIGHQFHLCVMCESGSCPLNQVKELVRNPKFLCRKCGRAAANEETLCEPVPL
jgi:hypothetical protein